ncbi:RidA family protein [Shewanella psychropiezotolerans]|uniref:RidA family protein n=1 Tax=Shewanella psychropiezotolerans TaxID=2593655 RepID=A0ABX5WYM8_9GAMM|nr:RidA family protein [Shewanella psychropiezotolerans]QDO82843.1 RidA family protein [Shewanella psychropiezotolerans]
MSRSLIPSSSPYADLIGFSRAVRIGNHVCIGGTAPIDKGGNTVGLNDPAAQAQQCIQTIIHTLEVAGASLDDVVRTRVMVTDIKDWPKIAEVHGEYFKHIRPASTLFQVSRFINPEWLIEIEVDAIIDIDRCID